MSIKVKKIKDWVDTFGHLQYSINKLGVRSNISDAQLGLDIFE